MEDKNVVKDIINYKIKQCKDRDSLGKQAADDVAETIKNLLLKKSEISMIFAAAPSQAEFLKYLCMHREIDFSRIRAFHMDEYLGLSAQAPQGFGNFLKAHLFDKVEFASVYYINGDAPDPAAECKRYARLLSNHTIDIVCLGYGENGHIAFNDPAVADFDDPHAVKIVTLDQVCRQQQVNDGCFTSLGEVPVQAITLTIPALLNADYHFAAVPAKSKAKAVHESVYAQITESCPATVMRLAKNMVLYVDRDSGALL